MESYQQSSPSHERQVLSLALERPSPYIPRLFAAMQDETDLAVVMEYVPGGSIQSLLDSAPQGRLSEECVSVWAAECVEAIEWIHEHGWAHRFVLKL
jgi:serine/threonine protein kinase